MTQASTNTSTTGNGSRTVAEQTISALFKNREQIDSVIRSLIDKGIAHDKISVIGKNFQLETRIAGFLTKKDLILNGLATGGLFGSLFGTILGLLTGVGVLFIPFVGTVVAAGPLGAALLGAAAGALAGSAGGGLASALIALGMPEDKAAIYENRVAAGEFLLTVEVPADRVDEIRQLLESAGAEEIHIHETSLPHKRSGQLESPSDISPEIRNHLSEDAQREFVDRYNAVLSESNDEVKAEHSAWDTVCQLYDEDENGVRSRRKAMV
ncbi:hypothetical protein BZZ01_11800 [Nostocales cyanobacterium HT-58-2]|nr:hypothetical protein BZZ01_11800 [Nostocales cyanobacterium HT-58-2]